MGNARDVWVVGKSCSDCTHHKQKATELAITLVEFLVEESLKRRAV